MSRGGGGGVPKGWSGCPKVCVDLIGGSFLAFKTPLKNELNQGLPKLNKFYVKDVFLHANLHEIALRVWIDLTNTTRYYNASEVAFHSNKTTTYRKMAMEGHGKIMGPADIESFVKECDDGLMRVVEGSGMVSAIGVHCTHGFNRTGFLICSYLMLRKGFTALAAIEEFAKKRPPGIYRGEYVEELMKMGQMMDVWSSVRIVIPYWDRKKTNFQRVEYISHWDFRKHEFPYPEVESIQFEFHLADVLSTFYKIMKESRMRYVETIEVQNGTKLDDKTMRMSWVTRGVGFYLWILAEDHVYLIADTEESKFCVWRVGRITFPAPNGGHLQNTLLWGELTKVANPVSGPPVLAYIISDVIEIQGDGTIRNAPFHGRQRCIKEIIMKPRHAEVYSGNIVPKQESFVIRTKAYYPIATVPDILDPSYNFNLQMPPKKIIFVPQNQVMFAGPVLEWMWPTAVFMVGPMSKDKTDEIQLISKEGTIVTTLSLDKLTMFPTLEPGSCIIGEWNALEGAWSVKELLYEMKMAIPDSLIDIQKVESSISKDVLLSLVPVSTNG